MDGEGAELSSLLTEAFKVVKGSINFCEARLEGGWEEYESSFVSAEVLSQDCVQLLKVDSHKP